MTDIWVHFIRVSDWPIKLIVPDSAYDARWYTMVFDIELGSTTVKNAPFKLIVIHQIKKRSAQWSTEKITDKKLALWANQAKRKHGQGLHYYFSLKNLMHISFDWQPVNEALQRSNQKHRGHSRALYSRPNMLSSMWSRVKIHQTWQIKILLLKIGEGKYHTNRKKEKVND